MLGRRNTPRKRAGSIPPHGVNGLDRFHTLAQREQAGTRSVAVTTPLPQLRGDVYGFGSLVASEAQRRGFYGTRGKPSSEMAITKTGPSTSGTSRSSPRSPTSFTR